MTLGRRVYLKGQSHFKDTLTLGRRVYLKGQSHFKDTGEPEALYREMGVKVRVITGDGIAASQTDMRVRVRFSDDRYIECTLDEVRCAAAPSAPPVSPSPFRLYDAPALRQPYAPPLALRTP